MSQPMVEHAGYRSYLLRLWTVEGSGGAGWRAALEDAHTGERVGFPNVEALFIYLRQITNDRAPRECGPEA
jgi:hypothetical protein